MNLSDRATRMRVNKRFRDQGDPLKVCGACFEVKSYDEFARRSGSVDGRQAVCRGCSTAGSTQWRGANQDRAREYSRKRYAADPERFKAASQRWRESNPDRMAEAYQRWFARNREHKKEYGQQWREDNRGYYRQWYESNRERVADNGRRWRADNPEKARAAWRDNQHRRRATEAEATVERFTARDLRHDWEDHDLYECFFCGCPLTDGYEVEHFYPLSKGGPHSLFNLVPSCVPCNRGVNGKHSREPWQFLRESLAEQGTDLDACLSALEEAARRRRR